MHDEKNPNSENPEDQDPVLMALIRFLRAWTKLPPLVRASAAVNLVAATDRYLDAIEHRAGGEGDEMPRRALVTKLFAQAYETQRQLFVDLTNAADNEAEDAGVNLDVRYDVVGTALAKHQARKMRRLRRQNQAYWEDREAAAVDDLVSTISDDVKSEMDKAYFKHIQTSLKQGSEGG